MPINQKKETDIQKEILEYLKLSGVDAWRNNNIPVKGRQFIGRKGVHDILGFYRPKSFPIGLFLSIEVKAPKKQMTKPQLDFRDMVTSYGHL